MGCQNISERHILVVPDEDGGVGVGQDEPLVEVPRRRHLQLVSSRRRQRLRDGAVAVAVRVVPLRGVDGYLDGLGLQQARSRPVPHRLRRRLPAVDKESSANPLSPFLYHPSTCGFSKEGGTGIGASCITVITTVIH